LSRQPAQLQRVTDDISYILNLGWLIIMSKDNRPLFPFEAGYFFFQLILFHDQA